MNFKVILLLFFQLKIFHLKFLLKFFSVNGEKNFFSFFPLIPFPLTEKKNYFSVVGPYVCWNSHFLYYYDDMVEMTYNMKDQFIDNSKDTNIFIAAFTTSHARMQLYKILDKLGDKVLGFDTDSCWYIEKENDPRIETGDSLGDLTDELGGHHIEKWCGTGPKSYSYCTSNGKMVCKVKGFTLNHENSQYINQQTMRQIIEGQKKRITTVNEKMIFRNNQTKQIENRYQEKDFRLCYDKRVMKKTESGIDTVPYGYIKIVREKRTKVNGKFIYQN